MDKEGVKISKMTKGLHIEDNYQKMFLSFEETDDLSYEEARIWCNSRGGGDESVDNFRFIQEHLDDINYELRRAGAEPIKGEYWSNEDYKMYKGLSWSIKVESGRACLIRDTRTRKARAIKQL